MLSSQLKTHTYLFYNRQYVLVIVMVDLFSKVRVNLLLSLISDLMLSSSKNWREFYCEQDEKGT